MNQIRKIILLGAGNLAWHMGPALQTAGYQILQVYSRSEESAWSLAEKLAVPWTSDPGELDPDGEILLYCVADSVIPELFCQIELGKRYMIHTSGSVPASVFKGLCRDYGVLYPVMTFSKHRELDLRNIPFCIEGSTPESTGLVEQMAGRLSNRVIFMDSEERKKLHLAGIIASNFSNHMYHLSSEFSEAEHIDFNLLKPLILETASKVLEMGADEAQTGPARRDDKEIIKEHIAMLMDRPELQKLYTFVSDSITKHFKST